MRIEFAEDMFLALELVEQSTDAGFCFLASVVVKAGFYQGMGVSEFDRIDASAFCAEIEHIQSTLRGAAKLGLDGLSSCSLRLRNIGTTGQFGLGVVVASEAIEPTSSLQHEFLFYTSSLNDVCASLVGFFRAPQPCT